MSTTSPGRQVFFCLEGRRMLEPQVSLSDPWARPLAHRSPPPSPLFHHSFDSVHFKSAHIASGSYWKRSLCLELLWGWSWLRSRTGIRLWCSCLTNQCSQSQPQIRCCLALRQWRFPRRQRLPLCPGMIAVCLQLWLGTLLSRSPDATADSLLRSSADRSNQRWPTEAKCYACL